MNGQQAQAIEKTAGGTNIMRIGFKLLSESAKLPTKANPADSGLDLYAAEDVIIAPGETVIIKTDLAVELPAGHEAQVRPRSGITSKTKLRVQLGTIDESYRGNIGVIVENTRHVEKWLSRHVTLVSGELFYASPFPRLEEGSYLIRKGDKIAQLVVQPIPQTVAVEVSQLSASDRGENGFGSSGV